MIQTMMAQLTVLISLPVVLSCMKTMEATLTIRMFQLHTLMEKMRRPVVAQMPLLQKLGDENFSGHNHEATPRHKTTMTK